MHLQEAREEGGDVGSVSRMILEPIQTPYASKWAIRSMARGLIARITMSLADMSVARMERPATTRTQAEEVVADRPVVAVGAVLSDGGKPARQNVQVVRERPTPEGSDAWCGISSFQSSC